MNKFILMIPMAGEGSRFRNAGYKDPKPFISVNDEPMIVKVLTNFKKVHHLIEKVVLICRSDHQERLDRVIKKYLPNLENHIECVTVDKLTEGAACTTLFAYNHINNDFPLVIANSDQLVDWDELGFLSEAQKYDGSILVFNEEARNPKWSFARVDSEGFVIETVEKNPVSDLATVGIYYFNHGKDYVEAAVRMIIENCRTNNEFYLCPVYNFFLRKNSRVSIQKIRKEDMHGLGTPEDLEKYLNR